MSDQANPAGKPTSNQTGAPAAGTSVSAETDWKDVVERIRAGREDGMEDLYRVFSRGIRFHLQRRLGSYELDDRVHDTFLIVVKAIREGELREPERLMGFIRTIVQRQVSSYIEKAMRSRREDVELDFAGWIPDARQDPETAAIIEERVAIMGKTLLSLSRRDYEILSRFYILEQPQHEICRAMGLSETQFRLFKSRAKGRFGEIGRKKIRARGLRALSVRNKPSPGH